jgi:hypothetical protein
MSAGHFFVIVWRSALVAVAPPPAPCGRVQVDVPVMADTQWPPRIRRHDALSTSVEYPHGDGGVCAALPVDRMVAVA